MPDSSACVVTRRRASSCSRGFASRRSPVRSRHAPSEKPRKLGLCPLREWLHQPSRHPGQRTKQRTSFVASSRKEAGRSAPGLDAALASVLPRTRRTLPAVLTPSTPRAGSALRALTGPRSPGRRHLSGQDGHRAIRQTHTLLRGRPGRRDGEASAIASAHPLHHTSPRGAV